MAESDIVPALKQRLSPHELREYCLQSQDIRLYYFAAPQRFLPRIQQTDYRDPAKAKNLWRYICEIEMILPHKHLRFPIGLLRGVAYELVPAASSLDCHMDVFYRQLNRIPPANMADSFYLCVNKCLIKDAVGKLLVEVPHSPILSPADSRRSSDASRLSESSSPSANSQLSQDSVPPTLAGVISGAFYLLGRLGVSRRETWCQRLDYHVLVSLVDHSVWIQYCAWDRRFEEGEPWPEDEWDQKLPGSPFKPDNGPDWARLPGFQSRILMARVAKNVRTWQFSNEDVAISDSEIWTDDRAVPAISGAILPTYDPKDDISPTKNPVRAVNYLRTIENAALRYVKFLARVIAIDPLLSMPRSRLLIHSLLSVVPLFQEIVKHMTASLKKPPETIRKGIDRLELSLSTLTPEFAPNNTTPSASISTIMFGIIAEDVMENMPGSSRGDIMREIARQLLMSVDYELTRDNGIPSIVAICLGNEQSPHLHFGASKDKWPRGSYMQQLSLNQRRHEMAGGMDFVREIVDQFNLRVNRDAENPKQHLLEAGFLAPVVPMPGHLAQAFAGDKFGHRDRCVRCRGTFGFDWAIGEMGMAQYQPGDIVDFEGYLHAGAAADNTSGKCAEYVVAMQCRGLI
ncbi:MAG: hypothetical protein M1829_002123 [Trizodia sp. TS-e1964]|nr:MAG: hypothetical protein M1829_002123 [Trizodia sp. TS-e1964]